MPDHPHPLIPRRALLAAGRILAVVLAGLLCSCQTDGEGNVTTPQMFRGADVTIRGAGVMEVRQAVAMAPPR